MRGAIVGDILGSALLGLPAGQPASLSLVVGPRCRPTGATHSTIAVAEHLLTGQDLASTLRAAFRAAPLAPWGWGFMQWAVAEPPAPPFGSIGCGAALRASPVAWSAASLDGVLLGATRAASVTHAHPEGVRAARALAAALHLALVQPAARSLRERQQTVRDLVADLSGYPLEIPLAQVASVFGCDGTGAGAVPPALIAALSADDFGQALERAATYAGPNPAIISLAGAVAEGFFEVPAGLWREASALLDRRALQTLSAFEARHGRPRG